MLTTKIFGGVEVMSLNGDRLDMVLPYLLMVSKMEVALNQWRNLSKGLGIVAVTIGLCRLPQAYYLGKELQTERCFART